MLNVLYYVYTFGRLECSSEINYVPLKLSEFLLILYFSNECGWVYGEQVLLPVLVALEFLIYISWGELLEQQLKRDNFYKGWNSLSIFLCWHLEKLQGIESDLKGIHPFKPLLWQTMRTESWFLGLRHMYKIAVLIFF